MSRFYPIFIFFLIVLSFLFPHILWGVGKVVGRFFNKSVAYLPFLWSSLCIFFSLVLLLLYGYYFGRWEVRVNQAKIESDALPSAFDGYRIVHISDLHLLSFRGHADRLQRVVDTVNSLYPDLVCFTGDLVTFSVAELEEFREVLSLLSARDGVYSVLGNHDCFPYDSGLSAKGRLVSMEQLSEAERSMGWCVLNNTHRDICRDTSCISVVGVMNQSSSMRYISPVRFGDLALALEGAEEFKVLLSHDPSHWQAEVVGNTDVQLTLSGHTHKAQLDIGGWSPISWFYKYTSGLYKQGKQYLYVNTGVGCTAPFRIGVPQEVTVIELHCGAAR